MSFRDVQVGYERHTRRCPVCKEGLLITPPRRCDIGARLWKAVATALDRLIG